MSLNTEIESAFKELESIHSRTMTKDGTSYACFTTAAKSRSGIEAAGFLPEGDIIIYVRASLFSAAPEPNERLTFDSVIYRIAQVEQSHGGSIYALNCVESEQA